MDEPLTPPPWERQPSEPTRWYARFELYRLAGPSRSVLGAVNADRQQRGRPKSRSIPQAWAKNAQQWHWRHRADAWDASQRQAARAAHAQEVQDMNRRHLQEAKALQSKAIQRLKELDLDELAAGDILRFCLQAAHFERAVLGEPSPSESPRPTDPGHDAMPFTVEDAVRADQELERWNHDRLHTSRSSPSPHRDPQVP